MSLSFEQAQFEINNLLRQHAQGTDSTGSTVPGYGEALAKARYEAMLRHARSLYDSAGNAQTQQQDQAMAQTQHDEELRRAQQDEMVRRAQHDENMRRLQMDHTISTGGQSIIPGTNGRGGAQQPYDGMAPTGPFVPDQGRGYAPGPWDLLPAYPGPYTPTGTGRGYSTGNPWDLPAYPGPFTPGPYPAVPTPTSGVAPGAPDAVPYNGGPMTKSFTPGGSWNPGLASPGRGAPPPLAGGYLLNQTGLTPSLFKGTEIATGVTATKPEGDAGFMPWGAGRGGTDIMRGGNQAFGGFGSSTKPTTDTWRPPPPPPTSGGMAPGYGSGSNPAWMNFMGGAPPPILDQRYNDYVSAFGSPTWTANG